MDYTLQETDISFKEINYLRLSGLSFNFPVFVFEVGGDWTWGDNITYSGNLKIDLSNYNAPFMTEATYAKQQAGITHNGSIHSAGNLNYALTDKDSIGYRTKAYHKLFSKGIYSIGVYGDVGDPEYNSWAWSAYKTPEYGNVYGWGPSYHEFKSVTTSLNESATHYSPENLFALIMFYSSANKGFIKTHTFPGIYALAGTFAGLTDSNFVSTATNGRPGQLRLGDTSFTFDASFLSGIANTSDDLNIADKEPDEKDVPERNKNTDSNLPNIELGGGDGDWDPDSDEFVDSGKPSLGASGSGFCTIYNPSRSEIQNLGKYMWNTFNIDDLNKFFTNPADAFFAFFILPLPDDALKGESREIRVGKGKTGVTAKVIGSLTESDQYVDVVYGPIKTKNYAGGYLNFSPYMKMKIFIPFVGLYDLDPTLCINNKLTLKYRIYLGTGDFVCWLETLSRPSKKTMNIGTWSGNCAMSIPLSSAQHTHLISSTLQAASTIGSSVATMLTPDVENPSAGVARSISSGFDALNAGVQAAKALKPDIKMSGAITGNAAMMGCYTPYIIYEAPKPAMPKPYQKYTGIATHEIIKLKDLKGSGYAKIKAINLHITHASDNELDMIKNTLMSGVIL